MARSLTAAALLSRCPVAIVLLSSAGCTAPLQWTEYRMPLTAVQRPADVAQRWGESRIEAARDTSRYEDDLVEIGVRAIDGTFALTVRNKTDQSLEVPWDGMVYVDSRGTSSGVVNHEVADATRDFRTRQVPTTIATRATAILTAVPWMNLQAGGTITDFVHAETATPALNGSEVRLVIPLIWEGVVNEYTVVFRLSDVRRVTFQTGSRCKLAPCTIDQAKQILLEEQLATVVAGDLVTVLGHGALVACEGQCFGPARGTTTIGDTAPD